MTETDITHHQPAHSVLAFNSDRFKTLYKTFTADTLQQLSQVYSSDIIFKDPLHEIQGMDALRKYFSSFCNPQVLCTFEFTNEVINNDQAFLQWTMRYNHPQLNGGKLLTLNGCTLIKFNSHIYYHEDFYDMGAMIYQYVPLVGWAIKKINARILGNNP